MRLGLEFIHWKGESPYVSLPQASVVAQQPRHAPSLRSASALMSHRALARYGSEDLSTACPLPNGGIQLYTHVNPIRRWQRCLEVSCNNRVQNTRTILMSDLEQLRAIKPTLANADMASLGNTEGRSAMPDIANLDVKIADVVEGPCKTAPWPPAEANLQTAENNPWPIHDVKSIGAALTHCVERVFTARPSCAQFRQGTYHGTNVPGLCTDIIASSPFAKEHQSRSRPSGREGSDFLANSKPRCAPLEASSAPRGRHCQPACPTIGAAFCESK